MRSHPLEILGAFTGHGKILNHPSKLSFMLPPSDHQIGIVSHGTLFPLSRRISFMIKYLGKQYLRGPAADL